MPRPRKPPHLLWSEDRGGTWCLVDGRTRIRLGLARGEAQTAQLRLAEYVVAAANAAATGPVDARPAARVTVEEVLDLYLAKRTDPDPLVRTEHVSRPRELEQRIEKLRPLWPLPVTSLSEDRLKRFAVELGSSSYARRCLADLQSALNEARRKPLFHEVISIWLPDAPAPREDILSTDEIVAILKVCTRRRDVQQRRIGGSIEVVDGRRQLVGGELQTVVGTKRPWAHIAKFLVVALATCSRSSRVYEASYQPEPGRPWVDLDRGVLYRMWTGERATKKRAPTIPLSPRLVAAMRRWSSDRVVNGRLRPGDRYVVQWNGGPVDCKKGWALALAEARRQYPSLFRRDDGTPKAIVRHTLRHTGVTMLADIPELSVEEVCAYAGMTVQMYERVYGHGEKSMAAKVAAAMGKKRKPKQED